MNRLSCWAVLLPLTAALWGCDDPLEKAQNIQGTRVLGAHVEVEGDPERAAPAPGEAASVSWLTAAPEPNPEVGYAFVACLSAPVNVGAGRCDTPPFASDVSAAPSAEGPLFRFEVPADADLDKTPFLNVLGVICAGANPEGDAVTATCPGGERGTRVGLALALAGFDDVPNKNPNFAQDAVLFDGEVWSPDADGAAPCTDGRRVKSSTAHEVTLVSDADAREPRPKEIESDPAREGLLFSHFSSKGELNRPFSELPPEAAASEVRVAWTAPGEMNAAEPVHFWFVLRDLRGGSTFERRSLCVEP